MSVLNSIAPRVFQNPSYFIRPPVFLYPYLGI